MNTMRRVLLAIACVILAFFCPPGMGEALTYAWDKVDGLNIFYREGGPADAPTLVLLHGYPLSSIQFDKLMGRLAPSLHVIAMDYPCFGFSDAPDRKIYSYTFDHIAETVQKFLLGRGVRKYGLYMQDYGVPVGFRLMSASPGSITFIVVQNGVIHLDGFPAAQDPNGKLRSHWRHRDDALDKRRSDYAKGLGFPGPGNWDKDDTVSPEVMLLMRDAVQRPGVTDARNDLWFDYGTNIARYPQWQELLSRLKIPTLVVWGSRDEDFTPAGAIAYLRNAPQAEIHILNTVHFASLEMPDEISEIILNFHRRRVASAEPHAVSAQ